MRIHYSETATLPTACGITSTTNEGLMLVAADSMVSCPTCKAIRRAVNREHRFAPDDQVPLYEHDCESCQYLGTWEHFDLYCCPPSKDVLARYGDEGPEYTSGIAHAHRDPALALALAKALHHRLLKPSDLTQR